MAHEESNRNTLQNNLPVEEIKVEVDIENMMECDQEEQLVNQPTEQQPKEQQPIEQQEDINNR